MEIELTQPVLGLVPYVLVEVVDADADTNHVEFEVTVGGGLDESHVSWLLELLVKKLKGEFADVGPDVERSGTPE